MSQTPDSKLTDPKNETPETEALFRARWGDYDPYGKMLDLARSLERRLRGAEAALIEATHNKELAENRERLTQERAEAAEAREGFSAVAPGPKL